MNSQLVAMSSNRPLLVVIPNLLTLYVRPPIEGYYWSLLQYLICGLKYAKLPCDPAALADLQVECYDPDQGLLELR